MVMGPVLRGMMIFLLPGALLFTGCAATQRVQEPLTLTTDDGQRLSATYYPALNPGTPAVILLPDARCDRSAFDKLPLHLHRAGFGVLSIDFRYKNLVGRAGSREEAIRLIGTQDLESVADYDAKSAIDFLTLHGGVDRSRIALVGTDLGANVALTSGVLYGAGALVLISLSENGTILRRGSVEGLLRQFAPRPALFMVSEKDQEGDPQAVEDNRRYYDGYRGKKDMSVCPGSANGAEILKTRKGRNLLLSWLKENL
jgi:dienelactone hydrolase